MPYLRPIRIDDQRSLPDQKISFLWKFRIQQERLYVEEKVEVRYVDAVSRGVPLPPGWAHLHRVKFDMTIAATEAPEKILPRQRWLVGKQLECFFLGTPKQYRKCFR